MQTFNDMLCAVIELLKEDEQCVGYRFVNAFPDTTVQNPVEREIVSVGLSSLKISQSALGEVIGQGEETCRIGRRADWKLLVRIYVPRSFGGMGCYDVFSAIAGALLERQSFWKIGEMGCGKTTYDRDTRTFGLECSIELTTLLQIQR